MPSVKRLPQSVRAKSSKSSRSRVTSKRLNSGGEKRKAASRSVRVLDFTPDASGTKRVAAAIIKLEEAKTLTGADAAYALAESASNRAANVELQGYKSTGFAFPFGMFGPKIAGANLPTLSPEIVTGIKESINELLDLPDDMSLVIDANLYGLEDLYFVGPGEAMAHVIALTKAGIAGDDYRGSGMKYSGPALKPGDTEVGNFAICVLTGALTGKRTKVSHKALCAKLAEFEKSGALPRVASLIKGAIKTGKALDVTYLEGHDPKARIDRALDCWNIPCAN